MWHIFLVVYVVRVSDTNWYFDMCSSYNRISSNYFLLINDFEATYTTRARAKREQHINVHLHSPYNGSCYALISSISFWCFSLYGACHQHHSDKFYICCILLLCSIFINCRPYFCICNYKHHHLDYLTHVNTSNIDAIKFWTSGSLEVL